MVKYVGDGQYEVECEDGELRTARTSDMLPGMSFHDKAEVARRRALEGVGSIIHLPIYGTKGVGIPKRARAQGSTPAATCNSEK